MDLVTGEERERRTSLTCSHPLRVGLQPAQVTPQEPARADADGMAVDMMIREFSDMFRREQQDLRRALEKFTAAQRQLAEQVARLAPPMATGDALEAQDEHPCVLASAREDDQAKTEQDEVGIASCSTSAQKFQLHRNQTSFLTKAEKKVTQGPTVADLNDVIRKGDAKRAKEWAVPIVSSPIFNVATGVIIMANSICIGIEMDLSLRGQDIKLISSAEHIFLIIYVLELILRYLAYGIEDFRHGWTLFDLVLVFIGVLTTWIIAPLAGTSQQFADGVQKILLLRTIRLLRVTRALRLVQFFKPLWKLVQGILSSAATMTSALLLILLTMYIFACMAGELITKLLSDDEVIGPLVQEKFGTLDTILLTLSQFVTADGIAQVYTPLVQRYPLLLFYFVPLVLIETIIVMNLVTAIIVEDAIVRGQIDQEMETHFCRLKMKELSPLIRKAFQDLDHDGDGFITMEEIVDSIGRIKMEFPEDLHAVLRPDKLLDLFHFLDLDSSGKLSEDEFVEGVTYLAIKKGSDTPIETIQLLHVLRDTRWKVICMEECLAKLCCKPDKLAKGARGDQPAPKHGNTKDAL